MLHAIIMAGGSGTRFWPESRHARPKQLLALAGRRTMLQSTVDRLGETIPADRTLIVTGRHLIDEIKRQLPDIPESNLVGEPCKRDTAPCIGLAAALVSHADDAATMLVMPSDHVIEDHAAFARAVRTAEELIEADPTRIVTFGIPPTYPAESFGYIERGASIDTKPGGADNTGEVHAYAVNQFREKPDAQTAAEYVAAKTFYWNSGIFMWRAGLITDALRNNVPAIADRIDTIAKSIGENEYESVLDREFNAIEGTSIDYAVMENYDNVVVIEAPFDWDDVGSWRAMARLNQSDESGNAVVGQGTLPHLGIDTSGCIIRAAGNHTIVTIDVDDLIIVQTDDATLVAPKHAEERVREVVKRLESEGGEHLL